MNKKLFSLIHLEKENDLNKILKAQKRSGDQIKILYVSLWDKNCKKLLKKLSRVYASPTGEEGGNPLYITNSFTMPHSFVIFKTTVVPHLVTLGRNFVKSQDYLPLVYEELGVG
jgi:hypothetical protein